MSRLVIRAIVLSVPLVLCSSSVVRGDEPTRQELMEQLRQLQARVEQLEANQQAAPHTPDQREVDRVVERIIADAQQRSRLLMQDVSLTAGFDLDRGKFFIRSADGNFLLVPGVLFQFRNVTNVRSGDDDDDVENGFDVRRMRLILEGNVFSPDWLYRFQWETNFDGGNVVLQDAFVRRRFADNWAVQFGQFYNVPFHEQTNLDPFLLAVDRSLINALIGGGQTDRVQGAMLIFDDREHWRAQAVIHDGYNSDNTDFTDGGGTNLVGVIPTNFGVAARLEHFFMGARRDYEQFSALGTTEDLLVLGGGVDFSQSGDSNALFHTVDLQFENTNGLGAYTALYGLWRDIGDDEPVPAGHYYDWGVLVQGSYLFTRSFEGFARYNVTFIDDELPVAAAEDTIHEITIGMNYYFQGHKAKLTVDLNWLPNGVPVDVRALGYLAGDDDQLVLRAMFQLFL